MKTHWLDGSRERSILTAMILDPTVLGGVAGCWTEDGLFASQWANLIGSWCVDHHRRYRKPPDKDITQRFAAWAASRPDKETVDLVERFLSSLSDNAEPITNPQFVLDTAGRYFEHVRLDKLTEAARGMLDAGQTGKAKELLTASRPVEVGAGAALTPYQDCDLMTASFDRLTTDPLVHYRGVLGQVMNAQLVRDAFVAFLAPEKKGKSYHLLDIGYRAMLERRRVAYFQVGDLSQQQILSRMYVRESGWPQRSTNTDGSWPCTVRWPVKIRSPEDDEPVKVVFEERKFDRPLSERVGWESEILTSVRKKTRSRRDFLRLYVTPTKTASARQVRGVVDSWAQRDWCADVVVVDYADVLAPVSHRFEKIDQIKETWEELRKLSQEFHCLVVTATQSNAAAYSARRPPGRSNFSGNHLKHAEVTANYGLTSLGEDIEQQVSRLSLYLTREGVESRCVYMAQCLALAHPTVLSTF